MGGMSVTQVWDNKLFLYFPEVVMNIFGQNMAKKICCVRLCVCADFRGGWGTYYTLRYIHSLTPPWPQV